MTPEIQLILQCARAKPSAAAIAERAACVGDWQLFRSLAARHDLRALCYWRLQQSCPESVPADVLAGLREYFLENSRRNLCATGELFRILDVLQRGGIDAAVFKGAVFAWDIYQVPGLREYADLDLLIQRRHLEPAGRLLRDAGYRLEAPGADANMARFFRFSGQMELVRESPRVVVDLHWDLAPHSLALALNAETLWPRLRSVTVAGRPVLSFSRCDQLLFAAWHGGKHGWTTLAWLADLAAMLEPDTVDWHRIFADAGRMRLSRSLHVALRLARDLLAVELPPVVTQRLEADAKSLAIARDVRGDLLEEGGGDGFFPRRLVYQLRLTEGWLRQLLILWRKVAEPNIADWRTLPSHSWFFGAYYVARPFRLFAKYVRLAGVWLQRGLPAGKS